MMGQLHIIYPDKPVEVRLVSHPVSFEEYQRLVGGDVEVIPYWDQHIDYGGNLRRAIVLADIDGIYKGMGLLNLYATAVWHYVVAARGSGHASRLTGPVVVCMGDDEFLESVLD